MTNQILPTHTINIDHNYINQRIDNFLRAKFRSIPKSMIYRIVRIGKITVNKKKVKPNYKLQFNDLIKIPLLKLKKIDTQKNIYKENVLLRLSKNILYEDKCLLVLNKPSGWAVHGGSGLKYNIIDAIRQLYPTNQFIDLVHRLDRETSGVLILAKKRSILKDLHTQLREKKIKKTYLALVHGSWPDNKKVINQPLLVVKKNKVKKNIINKNGKISSTLFFVKQRFLNTTLVKVIPITGRMHQIRVHAACTGYPIVGDKKYGKQNLNCTLKKKLSDSLLLHAHSIHFIHPLKKTKVYIKAVLGNNFKKKLMNLSN